MEKRLIIHGSVIRVEFRGGLARRYFCAKQGSNVWRIHHTAANAVAWARDRA
jgi:hypothetical protein